MCGAGGGSGRAGTGGAKIAGQAMFWTGLTAIPLSSVGSIYMVVEGDAKTGWITLGAGLAGALIAMVAGATRECPGDRRILPRAGTRFIP
ncbi:MAG: hypothetical protein IPK13_11955 [Deltaproteobacteria bacterium]|nr:hypothetical protein [Deltaproteobacteria bacterium]